jgi:hypothetical protein
VSSRVNERYWNGNRRLGLPSRQGHGELNALAWPGPARQVRVGRDSKHLPAGSCISARVFAFPNTVMVVNVHGRHSKSQQGSASMDWDDEAAAQPLKRDVLSADLGNNAAIKTHRGSNPADSRAHVSEPRP